MADLILKQWDNFGIRIREDRYVSLTDMARASGKKVKDWTKTAQTKSYLNELSSVVNIIPTGRNQESRALVEVYQGQNYGEFQGTWGHPKVALRFAQWCDEKFAIQVDVWIDELLTTGSVSLQAQKAPAKILNRNYASSQKECRDQLKRHGAGRRAYQLTEQYNNQLSGIESGCRHEVTPEQANQISCNYLFGAIELLKRDRGFNNGNDYHLANTCKMGMRHGMYEQLGIDSVPEVLKPKKERKQLKAG